MKSNAESIDYRQKGVVNDIKDQGQCQSNYAFPSNSLFYLNTEVL